MKGKTLLSLAIAALMMLAILPLATVKADVVPYSMEIVFDNGLHEITKAPCTNFTVTVKLVAKTSPALPITQFIMANLTWDPNVLELKTGTVADITQGTLVHWDTFLVTPDGLTGRIPEVTGILSTGTISGTGDLFYIAFHCKALGDTTITNSTAPPVLLNGLVRVMCDFVSGTVHQVAPPATPPHAVISITPTPPIQVGTTVQLSGASSTGGIDSIPPAESCPINWTLSYWTIDFENTTVLTVYGEYASFLCDKEGKVNITLTVIAPDPTPGDSSYVDHNSAFREIEQYIPPVGPAIDVWTNHGGQDIPNGPDNLHPLAYADAYGPQELVIVYAKVTYNLEPVDYKPVAFEMVDPFGNPVDFRTDFTDANGLATTSFRIPWEGSNAEALFGNWSVVGSVSISEVNIKDTVVFEFGYILSIREILVTGSPLKKGQYLTIDVNIKSISMMSHGALLMIVACDTCGVPIGIADSANWEIIVDANDGLQTGYTITIPPWAFVGLGTIYVNLFTNYPWIGGVPYCPERTATFTIKNTL